MGSFESQQTWIPYEATRDCTNGLCSSFCPQWCYIIFPPPPPSGLSVDESDGSATAFSPLVIAIIGILGSAFLLVSYYTLISKYCGTLDSLRRRPRRGGNRADAESTNEDPGNQSRQYEIGWHVPPSSNGLDEALINKIAVYRYRRGEGVVDGTDCSVCLGEFRDDDSLRLLPKCSHAFHVQCIDTWLKSHSNCPLCRAHVVSNCPEQPPPPPLQMPAPEPENNQPISSNEVAVVIDEINSGGEEENCNNPENECDASKDLPGEEKFDTIEIGDDSGAQPIRRSFSMSSSCCGRVPIIADVLGPDMEEDELLAADAGSTMRCRGEHSKERSRSLHCAMSPMPMERSFSSGRLCFIGYGRGRNAVLPI